MQSLRRPKFNLRVHHYRWETDFDFIRSYPNPDNPQEICYAFDEKITGCSAIIHSPKTAEHVDTDYLAELRQVGKLLVYLDKKDVGHGMYMEGYIVDRRDLNNLLFLEGKGFQTKPWVTDDYVPLQYAAALIRKHIGDIYENPNL